MDWNELDDAYLEIFGRHPLLKRPIRLVAEPDAEDTESDGGLGQ